MVLQDIHTQIFAEGFRDKIFDTETFAALGRALGDKSFDIRIKVVELFTVAMAQGALHCSCRIFIPKYFQRVFGTRYFTLRPLLHLDMHYVMNLLTSESRWSNFSLLR